MLTATFAIQNVLDTQTVNLQSQINARELIEETFVQFQSTQVPDPFLYTIDYYGYSQEGYGYLGYEIESIGSYVNGANDNYWVLYVNGSAASVGIDSYWVRPNDQVELLYQNFGAVANQDATTRLQHVQTRRTSRAAQRAKSQ
jgi:hypothetical protein